MLEAKSPTERFLAAIRLSPATTSEEPRRSDHAPSKDAPAFGRLMAPSQSAAITVVADLVLFSDLILRGDRQSEGHPPDSLALAFAALGLLVLLWRQRAPLLGCLLLCLDSAAASLLTTYHPVLPVCVALGTVAAQRSRSFTTLAAGMATVTVITWVANEARFSPEETKPSTAVGIGVGFVILLLISVGIGRWQHAGRQQVRALEDEAEALRQAEAERAAAAVSEERRRIGRELHDIISHSLGVVVLQAGAAEQVIDRDAEQAREVLRSIRATGQEAIGEMATLLGLMRGERETSREPQPSLADLDRLIGKTREAGVAVGLGFEGERRSLPAAVELSAFRVVQEGLTNALKHAPGAPITVTVRFREGELEVEVADEGGEGAPGPGGSHGLAGIRERVAVFGGRFEAGPRSGGGWAVRAAFPVAR